MGIVTGSKLVDRTEQSEDSNRKLMGKLTGSKLIGRMEQSKGKGPVQSIQQVTTVTDRKLVGRKLMGK